MGLASKLLKGHGMLVNWNPESQATEFHSQSNDNSKEAKAIEQHLSILILKKAYGHH